MSNIKFTDLPAAASNTFTTIYPNVQGGDNYKLAMSGFNTNDFVNIVDLGTGSTPTTLTFDASLADVFVYTFTGSSLTTYTTSMVNAVEGKQYIFIGQRTGSGQVNFGVLTTLSGIEQSTLAPFYFINGKFVTAGQKNTYTIY
jgi:hypothetical protein